MSKMLKKVNITLTWYFFLNQNLRKKDNPSIRLKHQNPENEPGIFGGWSPSSSDWLY